MKPLFILLFPVATSHLGLKKQSVEVPHDHLSIFLHMDNKPS